MKVHHGGLSTRDSIHLRRKMLRLLTEHSEGLVKETHCKMDLTTDSDIARIAPEGETQSSPGTFPSVSENNVLSFRSPQ